MAKSPPDQPGARKQRGRDPAKHSKKDPAKPTRAKAARADLAPIAPALAQLLNPGIEKGTAGVGSQTGLKAPGAKTSQAQAGGLPGKPPQPPAINTPTGLQPPPDNSFDRR